MRLLDDRGRLFGTVNLLDLLIGLAVIAIIAVAAMFVSNRGSVVVLPEDKDIVISMLVTNVRPEAASYVREGDIIKNQETQGVLGKIKDVVAKPAVTIENTAEGKKVLATSPRDKDVLLTIETKGRAGGDLVATGTEVLKVGSSLKIVTPWFFGNAIVTGLDVKSSS